MLLAVDRKRKLKGSLTAEKAREARKNNLTLKDVIDKNVRRIPKDMLSLRIRFNATFGPSTSILVVNAGTMMFCAVSTFERFE
jgi:glycine betaine/proline transport system ATP-binding protein